MEITGLGAFNIDDYRFKAKSSSPSAQDFREVLERAQAADKALFDTGISGETEPNLSARRVNSANAPIDKSDKLYQLCLELETFLIKNLITGMRNTVQKTGLVDDSFAGKMYEDMLYDEYAKDFTKSANFGLAEMAYRQLKTPDNAPR